jgi:hypothetical protein
MRRKTINFKKKKGRGGAETSKRGGRGKKREVN